MVSIVIEEGKEDVGMNYEEFDIGRDILSNYDDSEIRTSKDIFYLLLDDWMYGYKVSYTASNFDILFQRILDIIHKKKVLEFLLPGFPVKSTNKVNKVLGTHADYGEYLAVRSLLCTARKIEEIYDHGVTVTIMSDFHTFDQYIGVSEENYNNYHKQINTMISELGGNDVIQMINLASFPEFEGTASVYMFDKLKKDYGNQEFVDNFSENIKHDENLLERYKQMKKFMQSDQENRLPGSPRSKKTREFLKDIAIGMISQGMALDSFLNKQTLLDVYIRLSIHAHPPNHEKFAVDLFKRNVSPDHILRTPWHHTVLLDTKDDIFLVERKQNFLREEIEQSVIVTAIYKEKPWLLIRVYMDHNSEVQLNDGDLTVEMMKQGRGLKIRNSSQNPRLPASAICKHSLTSLIRHFGVVVLQGFKKFDSEEEFFDFYYSRSTNGVVPWKGGPVHVVKHSTKDSGYVNKQEGLPIHWDITFPPSYMEIKQSQFGYHEFTSREFVLYCHRNSCDGSQGPTTFVDAAEVLLAVPGKTTKKWKAIELIHETKLAKTKTETDPMKKPLYFGGKGNAYTYPLVISCQWTNQNVLRWLETWVTKDHPNTSQEQFYEIKNEEEVPYSVEELEAEVKKFAFDEKFFFEHFYEEGDQVYVNNYTMLHGRRSFTNERELWRIQLNPPTDNVPDYFVKYGHTYFKSS